jgi:YidC/Oxa1 family membrane protein insertase
VAAPAPAAEPAATPEADAVASEIASAPRVRIDTPRLSGSISLFGGRFDDLSLKDYKESLKPDAPDVRLLSPVGGIAGAETLPYYAVHGWQPAGGLAPDAVPGARTLWTLEEGTVLSPGMPVSLRWDNGAGLIFHRRITVDDNYLFTIVQSVENRTGAAVRLAPYGIVVRHGVPNAQRAYVRHEGLVRNTDGELGDIKYSAIPKLDIVSGEGQADVIDAAHDGWIGFTDAYWMTTLVPQPGTSFKSVVKYVAGGDIYQAETRMPVREVAPGATVVTDGLSCFRGAADAGCIHVALPTGSGRRAARHPAFRWVNTVLGNIKSAITGTYRAIRKKHMVRYLAEFEWRFNHRFDLAAMMPALARAALATTPQPYWWLKMADYGA